MRSPRAGASSPGVSTAKVAGPLIAIDKKEMWFLVLHAMKSTPGLEKSFEVRLHPCVLQLYAREREPPRARAWCSRRFAVISAFATLCDASYISRILDGQDRTPATAADAFATVSNICDQIRGTSPGYSNTGLVVPSK